ncbi:sulfurtransferase TusA family protein [Tistrella bauzanensis]|nr:sulfurtransferase TusA family protein [Tistrella bauzanensis]
MKPSADRFLDVTHHVCPMTFVKTKLMIGKMSAGEIGEVRLNGGEPLENVPRSVVELGHQIVALNEEAGSPGVWRLLFKVRG